MYDTEILIAGGGIAGLATSLGLARNNRHSLVLERAPVFEEFGAGLQLGPNAVKALQLLGAWDAVAPACVIPAEVHIKDGRSGKLLQRLVLGRAFESRFGAPYRVVHRADLHYGLLLTAHDTPGITLQTGAEITAVSTATTSLTLAAKQTLKAQAILGTDGVHSLIRKNIQQEDGYGEAQHTLHRALIPFGQVPPSIASDVVTLWLLPKAHVVHYAVSNWRNFNIVAAVEGQQLTPAQLAEQACSPLSDLLKAAPSWTAWPGRDVVPNPNWFAHKTLLLGDAAHATLPYLAQGAAMALEDACELALMSQNKSDIDEIYASFRDRRFPRTKRIQQASRQQGKIYHASGFMGMARNLVMKSMNPESLSQRLSWLYHWTPPV